MLGRLLAQSYQDNAAGDPGILDPVFDNNDFFLAPELQMLIPGTPLEQRYRLYRSYRALGLPWPP